MRRVLRILFLVVCGCVGAWVGYWIGHLAGWSQKAEWPGKIGGGSGAILLSIGMSVLFVILAARRDPGLPHPAVARAPGANLNLSRTLSGSPLGAAAGPLVPRSPPLSTAAGAAEAWRCPQRSPRPPQPA